MIKKNLSWSMVLVLICNFHKSTSEEYDYNDFTPPSFEPKALTISKEVVDDAINLDIDAYEKIDFEFFNGQNIRQDFLYKRDPTLHCYDQNTRCTLSQVELVYICAYNDLTENPNGKPLWMNICLMHLLNCLANKKLWYMGHRDLNSKCYRRRNSFLDTIINMVNQVL